MPSVPSSTSIPESAAGDTAAESCWAPRDISKFLPESSRWTSPLTSDSLLEIPEFKNIFPWSTGPKMTIRIRQSDYYGCPDSYHEVTLSHAKPQTPSQRWKLVLSVPCRTGRNSTKTLGTRTMFVGPTQRWISRHNNRGEVEVMKIVEGWFKDPETSWHRQGEQGSVYRGFVEESEDPDQLASFGRQCSIARELQSLTAGFRQHKRDVHRRAREKRLRGSVEGGEGDRETRSLLFDKRRERDESKRHN